MSTERMRVLGDPAWRVGRLRNALVGIHNGERGHGRESDRLIVAAKRGNARGAKGPECTHVSMQGRETPLERTSLSDGLGG